MSQQAPARSAVAKPPSMVMAIRLMYVGTAISIIGLVVNLTVGASTGGAAVNRGGGGIVLGIIAVGLWAWMIWKNGEGRSWARIVATVFGGLSILAGLYNLVAPQATIPTRLVGLVQAAVAIAIIVFFYKKDSGEFYAANSC